MCAHCCQCLWIVFVLCHVCSLLSVSLDCLCPVSCVLTVVSVSGLSSPCAMCAHCCQCLWIVFVLCHVCSLLSVSLDCLRPVLCVPTVVSVSGLSSPCVMCAHCCQCLWIVFVLCTHCCQCLWIFFVLCHVCPLLTVSLDCLCPVSCVPTVASVSGLSSSCVMLCPLLSVSGLSIPDYPFGFLWRLFSIKITCNTIVYNLINRIGWIRLAHYILGLRSLQGSSVVTYLLCYLQEKWQGP